MKTILVVDDFASVRFYHERLLKQAGYATLGARDGAEAFAQLERNPVDLVMLDMIMPNMNGTQFLQRVRSNQRYTRLPIIIVSTEAQPDIDRGSGDGACGAVKLLNKPILPDVLLKEVGRLLS
jgi:CheY-like chemotaxis protein